MKKHATAVRITGITIFALLFLAVVLLGVEVYFRFQSKYPRSHFQYDPELIWRLKTNYKGRKLWGDDHFPLRFNEQGFRGPDFKKNKPEGVERLMVIGDSYTASLDVRYQDLYTTLLQKQLNTGSEKRYEVLNASCPAWGADQEYLYWMTEGITYQPDYLLLMVAPNDIREMYMKKLLEVDDKGGLKKNPVRYPARARRGWWWSNRSAFFQYLQKEVWDSHYGHFWDIFIHYPVNFGKGDSTNWDLPLFLENPYPEVSEAKALFRKLIVSMNASCRRIGCKMLISVIPTKMEFDGTLASPEYKPGAVADLIAEIAEAEGIPYLNLFEDLSRAEDPMELFISWEFHFNEEGNAYLAEKLYPFILSNQ